ncbi:MAG: hypothetical protein QXZ12_06085 [Thermoplasmata archaeon]
MTRIFRILGAITIVLILIVVIPTDSKSDVVISNRYNVSTSSLSPSIVYNNSTITYVTITIDNNQLVSTLNNFQMLIKVDWLEYKNYLNSYCSNIRFYNSTTAIGRTSGYEVLPAWIETNDTNNANSSNVWINMKGTTIPASGSVNIYMAFLPKTVSWNSYLGLNPMLSATYGQYDNGKYVFLYYNNGLNLMPLTHTGSGGYGPTTTVKAPSPYLYAINGSVNGGNANANTWTTNGINTVSSPSFNLPTSYIAQMRVYLSGTSPLTDLLTNVQSITTGQFYVFRFDARGGSNYDAIGYYSQGSSATTFLDQTTQSSTKTWYQMTAIDDSDNLILYKSTYSSTNTFTLNKLGTLIAEAKGKGYTGGGIAVSTDGASSTEYWTMIIVRSYPPNGIMPSYSFSTILGYTMWHTNLNKYKDQAYSNITSIWSSDIYCDDNGNVYWTDTYGNLSVAFVNLNYNVYSLGTPYSHFAYAGPITSIAAVNYTINHNYFSFKTIISEVVELSYYGYVFGCYINNDTWFNATQQWKLPLTSYPSPWTSVTSNVEGYSNHYDEGFFFTDLSGNLYFYDTTTSKSRWLITSNPSDNIISTVAYYNSTLHRNNKFSNIYGISYNGFVFVLTSSNNGNGYTWSIYNKTGINDLVGITMDNSGYLYLLQLKNGTSLNISSTAAGSATGTFSSYGSIVFSQGTSEAITYDQSNNIFWAIQTNGTIAGGDPIYPIYDWGYSNNFLYTYNYPTILAINSTYSMKFYAYALYLSSKNITSMYNFSLFFTGSDSKLDLEYSYQNGNSINNAQTALLESSNGILINVTMMPNMAYNSTFYFYSVFYPQNNPNSVILEYVLNIRIINHFSYITI